MAAAANEVGDEAGSVARVETDVSVGTAFVVADGLLVTNQHVVDGSSVVDVVFSDGVEHCSVDTSDPGRDLALLACATDGHDALRLAGGPAEIGADVTVLGYPGGSAQLVATRGIVSSPNVDGYVRTDAALNPGNSGGPVLDDEGTVVGVATLVDTREDSAGYAIPATQVRAFVGDRLDGGTTDGPGPSDDGPGNDVSAGDGGSGDGSATPWLVALAVAVLAGIAWAVRSGRAGTTQGTPAPAAPGPDERALGTIHLHEPPPDVRLLGAAHTIDPNDEPHEGN